MEESSIISSYLYYLLFHFRFFSMYRLSNENKRPIEVKNSNFITRMDFQVSFLLIYLFYFIKVICIQLKFISFTFTSLFFTTPLPYFSKYQILKKEKKKTIFVSKIFYPLEGIIQCTHFKFKLFNKEGYLGMITIFSKSGQFQST